VQRGKGGGTEGRGLHLRGSSGAALGGSRSVFPRVLKSPTSLSRWASRPEKEELEMALGRGAGRGHVCRAKGDRLGGDRTVRARRSTPVLALGPRDPEHCRREVAGGEGR
jgi:hypothetical protein